MANAFTKVTAFRFGGPNSKQRVRIKGTLAVDTAAGAVAGDIPASLFGLVKITACGNLVLSDNSVIIPAAPAADEGSLMVGGGAANIAADLANGTYHLWLEGY